MAGRRDRECLVHYLKTNSFGGYVSHMCGSPRTFRVGPYRTCTDCLDAPRYAFGATRIIASELRRPGSLRMTTQATRKGGT